MKKKLLKALILLPLTSLILLTSCSYLMYGIKSSEEKKADLESILPKVAKSYSWHAFDELVPFVKKDANEIFRKISKQYKSRKIHEVAIDQVEFRENANRAFTVFEIKSFSLPSLTLNSHYDQIEWFYDESNDGWEIKSINFGSSGGGGVS